MAILDKFFSPSILDDTYTFSASGIYFAPPEGGLSDYVGYLESLPLEADPEIFGMHENANLTFQNNSSSRLVATILSIQPREMASASGVSSDTVVSTLALEMEERMPNLLDAKKAGAETFKMTSMGILESLGTVLVQEMERFNKLLSTMKSSLAAIQKAIKGEVVMSSELDKMYTSLLNNRVPEMWARVAYPSLKPLASWVADLHQRIAFMQEWLINGPPNSFWLSGFFFPQGFMTGVLQTHARKYQLPIDALNFTFEVLDVYDRKEVEKPAEDGVFIDGLYMDGARWDDENRCVTDSKLGELFARVPVIHFLPTDQLINNPTEYSCPVYKTSVRAGVLSTTGQSTNYVLSVSMPCKQDPALFILKGAALLCQLDN
jgi:dynein heavy chain